MVVVTPELVKSPQWSAAETARGGPGRRGSALIC
jgi:hypothetical protein